MHLSRRFVVVENNKWFYDVCDLRIFQDRRSFAFIFLYRSRLKKSNWVFFSWFYGIMLFTWQRLTRACFKVTKLLFSMEIIGNYLVRTKIYFCNTNLRKAKNIQMIRPQFFKTQIFVILFHYFNIEAKRIFWNSRMAEIRSRNSFMWSVCM